MISNSEIKRERCGAFIIKDEKILLIKRIKPNRSYWVFPGGGREKGERLEDCLKREMSEELGLRVEKCKKCVTLTDFENGMKETYFLTEVENAKPEIVGEEKERESENNKYSLTFEELSILDNENLFPPFARVWLKEYLEKN